MSRFRVTCYLASIALLFAVLGGLSIQSTVQAMPNTGSTSTSISTNQISSSGEKITLTCQYPVLSSYAGAYFSYKVELLYSGGTEPKVFDLRAKVPAGFISSISPGYGEGTEIAAIRLDPHKTYPDTINVTVRPYAWLVPEPGEYDITVEVSSGEIKASIDLKAIVTAKYDLEVEPSSGLLNTKATAGKDNYFNVSIINTGSADIEKINFSSRITGGPSGWSITFNPESIDSLPAGDKREIQVDIKPTEKTIAGDYMITISAEPEAKNAFGSFNLRVTVLTPTIWGWVGIGIVILVIAGLAFMFMRLGRR
ncbi:MAG: hypothetical protein JSV54_00310 [Chloroflexota bacterium]|nr:MAG: hypothetical protein JSV54_00310 [Chloroflexota bacterium]